MGTGEELYIT